MRGAHFKCRAPGCTYSCFGRQPSTCSRLRRVFLHRGYIIPPGILYSKYNFCCNTFMYLVHIIPCMFMDVLRLSPRQLSTARRVERSKGGHVRYHISGISAPGVFLVGVPNLPKCPVPVLRSYRSCLPQGACTGIESIYRTIPECSVGY